MWRIDEIVYHIAGYGQHVRERVICMSWQMMHRCSVIDVVLYNIETGEKLLFWGERPGRARSCAPREGTPFYDNLIAAMRQYKPIGYIDKPDNPYMLVVDSLSYKFFDYVDGFELVSLSDPGVDARRIHSDGVKVVPVTEDGKYFRVLGSHWELATTLLHAMLYSPRNWLTDDMFVFGCARNEANGYLVKFKDLRQAKMLLKRAPIELECDMLVSCADAFDKGSVLYNTDRYW